MMYHIPAVLSPQEVDYFSGRLQQAEWVDGRATTGDQGAQVKNNQQVDTRSALYDELQGKVLAALNRSSLFFAAALPKTPLQPAFQPLPAERNLRFSR
ncbi:PKHD-type hydroxylase Sbal_3634 [Raoultella terrigena]|uniref:PKHD-type hydroxylase Sbal_3634 n=1 Tax=Raoultella terrigena TaxID=577 RepID=A0A485B7C6_RAOTE|nr:PKHD-type hydroxylase Sbal_3634 [Raoultella terrigena]